MHSRPSRHVRMYNNINNILLPASIYDAQMDKCIIHSCWGLYFLACGYVATGLPMTEATSYHAVSALSLGTIIIIVIIAYRRQCYSYILLPCQYEYTYTFNANGCYITGLMLMLLRSNELQIMIILLSYSYMQGCFIS